MHSELAECHRVFAHLGVVLPVQEVIEALRVVAELLGGGVDAMVGDVLDQLVARFTIKLVPGCCAWPLDAVLVKKTPAGARVVTGQGFQFLAQRRRRLFLVDDLKRLRRPSPPCPALRNWSVGGRRHTTPQSRYVEIGKFFGRSG